MSKPKTVVLIDNPYSQPEWPKLEAAQANDLLDLLVTILSPISEYRASLPRSTGKRKRRQAAKETSKSEEQQQQQEPPSPPSILRYVVAGVNATTTALESAVNPDLAPLPDSAVKTASRLRCVFVCRADGHPTQLHAHLPALCQLAKPPVKLLALPKGAESRLTESLGIPRLGVLGLVEGAPGTDILWEAIEPLPTVEVPWVKERSEWQTPKIKQIQTKPVAKKVQNKQGAQTPSGDGKKAKKSKPNQS
ncbi:hypothetical protein EX30DRAFT_394930 [Ascodesmis nigricans]|uniref:Uncharacterized protein n=1 Tax=Ascodesmis nigricans TaxID=341454 RepID=A0A4S2MZ59_9PEZI|nr:hypothetical protein EX30DRAFT_394930 [Ascodesmis nigricans]